MIDVWREEHPVRFTAVDRSDRLSLAAAFDLFQEAALCHAESLGVGRDSLARTGQVWVLSRMSVYMERRPRFGERMTVETWPRGWEKLFAVRDYRIEAPEGNTAVRGRSGWLILDIEKRRPLRVQPVVENLPSNEGRSAFSALPPGLGERPGLQQTARRTALYSDIDFNGHVNNARYIQWIEDALPEGILEGAHAMRLDVNYLSEVKRGEAVELWTGTFAPEGAGADMPRSPSAAIALEGRRPEDGKAVLRAELVTGAA
ncbi:MAG: acyl-ACP thioesterase [Treponema sp.]|jgi:acyl-ACP thioesterase|nr:acyl-ACP thioesterase [Treponema sp.]